MEERRRAALPAGSAGARLRPQAGGEKHRPPRWRRRAERCRRPSDTAAARAAPLSPEPLSPPPARPHRHPPSPVPTGEWRERKTEEGREEGREGSGWGECLCPAVGAVAMPMPKRFVPERTGTAAIATHPLPPHGSPLKAPGAEG